MGGIRAGLYTGPAFQAFRSALQGFEPDRPERLAHVIFQADEPQELLIDEIEAIWSAIAQSDDWSPLSKKLEAIALTAEARL